MILVDDVDTSSDLEMTESKTAPTVVSWDDEQIDDIVKKPRDYEFKRSTGDYWYYDQIPDNLLKGRVCEIGAGSGENQLWSRHKKRFFELSRCGNYIGIDIADRKKTVLNIQQIDVLEWTPKEKFDTVIAIELIEHIQFREWEELFKVLISLVKPGGVLYLSTPYNQQLEDYIQGCKNQTQGDPFQVHVTFGITESVIHHFLPGAKCIVKKRYNFREEGESFLWALARYLKRVVTRHPYTKPSMVKLFAIWSKPLDSE
jgi:SAM-dependent methyltransferase